jgi:hypothetical protein
VISSARREGFFSSHSRMRSTLQPRARNRRETRKSRWELTKILSRQNRTLDFEAFLQRLQPCQKHPSTNKAISELGKIKSGRPGKSSASIFHPESPRCTSIARNLFSVVRPPLEVTRDIMRERALGVTRSINELVAIALAKSIIRLHNKS